MKHEISCFELKLNRWFLELVQFQKPFSFNSTRSVLKLNTKFVIFLPPPPTAAYVSYILLSYGTVLST